MPKRMRKTNRRMRRRARMSSRSLATKSFVRKEIHKDDETKYFEFATTGQTVGYTGVTVDCMAIPQGVGDLNRVGDKIRLRGIKFNFIISNTINSNLRVMLVQCKQNTQLVTPAVNQLLVPTTLGTINAPIAQRLHDYQNLFNVIYDKVYTVCPVTNPMIHQRKTINIKYARKEVSFYSGGTTGSNKIYLMLVSDQVATFPTIQYQLRFYYDDA